MKGCGGEDGGFTVCICSSIDGQGCHAVRVFEHGGGQREHGEFGDSVSGRGYVQRDQEGVNGTAE